MYSIAIKFYWSKQESVYIQFSLCKQKNKTLVTMEQDNIW